MSDDVTRGRAPTARLSDCEKYIRANTGSHIETVIDVADAEKFRVVNKVPDDPEPFETLVFDAADRFDLDVRETGLLDVLYICIPGA